MTTLLLYSIVSTAYEGVGGPGRIRTCNPRIRSPIFYPVELRDRLYFCFIYQLSRMFNHKIYWIRLVSNKEEGFNRTIRKGLARIF